MPTPDLRTRLDACKQSPLDDSLRLALADWLEANGEPERAEFVRIQIREAESGSDWYPGKAEDRVRKAELQRQFTSAWSDGRIDPENNRWFVFGDGREAEGTSRPGGQFERGLIRISADALQLGRLFDQLPSPVLPWLETLAVRGVTSDLGVLRGLFDRPEARQFTGFSFSWRGDAPPGVIDLLDRPDVQAAHPGGGEGAGQLIRRLAAARYLRPCTLSTSPDPNDPESWAALMGSPVVGEVRHWFMGGSKETRLPIQELAGAAHLRRLTSLYLSGDGFPVADLRALFDSPCVRGLTKLHVSGYSGSLSGVVSALVPSRSIRGLEKLNLMFNKVTAAEAAALARSAMIEPLRSLSFSSGTLAPDGLKALAGSPLLGHLEVLNLGCTGVGDAGLIALANSPYLKNLRRLSVCRCGITARGLFALVQSPLRDRLESLDLSLNPLDENALDLLPRSPRVANIRLRYLGLRGLRSNPAVFHRLMHSPSLARLEHLDLQSTPLSLAHIRSLASSPVLTGLRKLVFNKNALPPGEINDLMGAAWLAGIVELRLNGTGLTDEGVSRLTQRTDLDRLRDLDLGNNGITNAAAKALLSWPGLPRLVDLNLYKTAIDSALEQELERIVSLGSR